MRVGGAKAPSFSEIVEFYASQGKVYAPHPAEGGWGKFVRTFIIGHFERRRLAGSAKILYGDKKKQQLKKGGRGWLHIE